MPFYEWLGKRKAYRVYHHAKKSVPAYKKFVEQSETVVSSIKDFSKIKSTSKDTYIKKSSIEDRCIWWEIPATWVIIDESSGTSGTPTNRVRWYDERHSIQRMLQIAFKKHFWEEKVISINAFALWVWATWINVSISLVDTTILKSTGPDVEKIINTLEFFGPTYKYVIMWYPPFLKSLIDTTDIDRSQYDISVVFGGEWISEELREYLLNFFTVIYGSYWASDLEINMAAESDFSIKLRQEIIKNPEFAADIINQEYGVIPLIFQYHPLDYYIETSLEWELLVTINRYSNLSPRVRYNIQDLGHVLTMRELKVCLKKHNIDTREWSEPVHLPFLFHYGRSTWTIAYYGCKLKPNDMQAVIVALPELTSLINSFAYDVHVDENHDKILEIKIELYDWIDAFDEKNYAHLIKEKLMELNQDFKEAYSFVPDHIKPKIAFYQYKTDSFSLENDNIKKRYFIDS